MVFSSLATVELNESDQRIWRVNFKNEFTRRFGRRFGQSHAPHFRLGQFFSVVSVRRTSRSSRVFWCVCCVCCVCCVWCCWYNWYRLRWGPGLASCTPTTAANWSVIKRLTIAHLFLTPGARIANRTQSAHEGRVRGGGDNPHGWNPHCFNNGANLRRDTLADDWRLR